MLFQFTDYNGATGLFAGQYQAEWHDVELAIQQTPLHLKASDQAGLVGNAIFDPVGNNYALRAALVARGWSSGVPIPAAFDFLGTDVDFVKNGVLGEVQFSNYPFLLNNVVRSELFSKGKLQLAGHQVGAVLIITKAHMFPASNSTLYYEQARKQLNELAKHSVLASPVRLVGLFETPGAQVSAMWTDYHASRYSRTVVARTPIQCNVANPRKAGSRCGVQIIRP